MPEKSLILPDWQADAAAKGRLTQISVPVKPQPVQLGDCYDHPPGWLWPPGSEPGEDGCRWPLGGNPTEIMSPWCPYPPGTVLVGRETWKPTRFDGTRVRIEYKADNGVAWRECPSTMLEHYRTRRVWHSPATMPRWAARHRWTVEAVSVRRVGEQTSNDYIAEGANGGYCERARLWQSRHGDRCPWPDAWVWVLTLEPEKV